MNRRKESGLGVARTESPGPGGKLGHKKKDKLHFSHNMEKRPIPRLLLRQKGF